MPAGEERRQVSSRWSLKIMQIHKYAWNTNTITQGKTRNTQIQKHTHTHTNTNITIGSLSQIRGGEKWKSLLMKTALTSVPEYFQKVPGCQNEPIPQGWVPPIKIESAKNLFMGGKVVRSIKKLGEDRIFSASALFSEIKKFQILFNFLFLNLLTFSFFHHPPNDMVVLGRRKN